MDIRPPVRAAHDYVQRLVGPPAAVFPLLCPVRETEWVPGWDPTLVVTDSGVAEEECVFVMPGHDGPDPVWVVTEYTPPTEIGFVKVTGTDLVMRIRIRLEADGPEQTRAHVRYSLTALSAAGEAEVAAFGEERYRAFMGEWEDQLNGYLRTTPHG